MTTTEIAAQAGDEPMLPIPVARMYSLNGYRRASVSAGPGEPLFAADQMRAMFRAGQVSPRATADVERLRAALKDLIEVAERCDSWQSFPSDALDAARRATTKPGA